MLSVIITWSCQKCGWANDNNNGPCRKCGANLIIMPITAFAVEAVMPADPKTINMAALEAILLRASELNAQLHRLFLDARAITGESRDDGFTYEAVYNADLTASELVKTIAAGHYVREG